MKIEIGSDILHNFQEASSREWLETNGLGGWSSSSICNCNTRNYHGVFVSAVKPPVQRVVMLSKLDEIIVTSNGEYEISCNQFPGITCTDGLKFLKRFRKELFPVFEYEVEGINIEKTVAAVHNEDKVVIQYDVKKASGEFTMLLKPLLAFRDYHSLAKANDYLNRTAEFGNSTLKVIPYPDLPPLYIYVEGSSFRFDPSWYYNFEYLQEKERGLNCNEDLFCHGMFSVRLREGSKLNIVISTEEPKDRDVSRVLKTEAARREALLSTLKLPDDTARILALAADQFVVKRGEDLRTILAGYHWFSDWGRDTMISLPGICLVTGRFEEAKKILKAFSESIDMGMLPNRFPDQGEAPEYNTVDATLWYFIAARKYLDYSGDEKFVLKELLPCLENIVEWHDRGTRYNIKVDHDGLLSAGEPGVQLTWMDAKVGDWVVTPRIGKPVEVNALWYNAIKILADLLRLARRSKDADEYEERAAKIRHSFNEKFLYHEGGYLYDYINGEERDTSFRPNQIFALSLPYELLDREASSRMMEMVEQKLLTNVGLRSLAPEDPHYIKYYGGDQLSRDGAYHQGTVWSWLLGPYMTARIKLEGDKGREHVKEILKKFHNHFYEAGIGTVSEIFDAEYPHRPKGCIAQAWGVAEILRVYLEDLYPEDFTNRTYASSQRKMTVREEVK